MRSIILIEALIMLLLIFTMATNAAAEEAGENGTETGIENFATEKLKTETGKKPGADAFFAILGLLAVAYLVRRS